jgi:hypothetical protein
LTSEIILQAIAKTEPDSRQRKRFCMGLSAFAKFAAKFVDLAIDIQRYAGSYNPRRAKNFAIYQLMKLLKIGLSKYPIQH